MRRPTRTLIGAAMASALAIGVVAAPTTSWAQSGDSHTVVLHPGQSIQAAIDAAAPGTTIVVTSGTYRGNLTITKTVSLRGDGSVIIAPAATFAHNVCTDDPSLPPQPNGQPPITGICIGDITPTEQIIQTVADVHLSGLEVRGFDGGGLFAAGTTGLTVDNVEIDHNGDYGAIADLSDHLAFRAERIHDNASGGLHFAADHDVVATANRSYANNAEGIVVIDSSRLRLDANQLTGNCVGLVAVDTGYPGRGRQSPPHRQHHPRQQPLLPGPTRTKRPPGRRRTRSGPGRHHQHRRVRQHHHRQLPRRPTGRRRSALCARRTGAARLDRLRRPGTGQ